MRVSSQDTDDQIKLFPSLTWRAGTFFVHWNCAMTMARSIAAAKEMGWTTRVLPPPLADDDDDDRRVLSLGRASFCVILRSSPFTSLMSSYLFEFY